MRWLLPVTGLVASTLLVASAVVLPWSVDAGHEHHQSPVATLPKLDTSDTRRDSLPIEVTVGDAFRLVDQDGQSRDRLFFAQGPTLIFFGYASCDGICLTAVPRMAEAVAKLEELGAAVRPVLITIDPTRDTPEAMAAALAEHHPRYVGLTGSDEALAAVREMFGVRKSLVSGEPADAVYQHGSFFYLLDANARLMTVLPPILGASQIADIVAGYVATGCSDPDALNTAAVL